MLSLGLSLANSGSASDLLAAAAWCEAAGEQGDPLGHFVSAHLLREAEPDLDAIRIQLGKAAELGLPEAMVELANALSFGAGGDGDLADAVAWYVKAAGAGHELAARRVAEIVESRPDIAEHLKLGQAIAWFELGGRLGDSHCSYRASRAHRDGSGVKPDEDAARFWLELSAAQGYSIANLQLAMAYRLGKWGFAADDSLADLHERKAAECSRREICYEKERRYLVASNAVQADRTED